MDEIPPVVFNVVMLIFKYIIWTTIDKIITKRCNEYLRKIYLNLIYKYEYGRTQSLRNQSLDTRRKRG